MNKTVYPFFLLLSLCIFSCKSTQEKELFNTGKTREEIMSEIPPYPVFKTKTSDEITAYLRFYDLEFENIQHYLGYLDILEFKIFTQSFIPEKSKGTVYIFHSFLSHIGLMNDLITFLIRNNYSVCAIDLPGHGFSSGERAHIESFNQYGDVIHHLLEKTASFMPLPLFSAAHSMGCAALMNYFMLHESEFRHHIFLGPLVRSDLWYLSRIGYSLIGWANPLLPYWHRDISSDREYMEYMQHKERLFVRQVPVTWVKALFDWNDYPG